LAILLDTAFNDFNVIISQINSGGVLIIRIVLSKQIGRNDIRLLIFLFQMVPDSIELLFSNRHAQFPGDY